MNMLIYRKTTEGLLAMNIILSIVRMAYHDVRLLELGHESQHLAVVPILVDIGAVS